MKFIKDMWKNMERNTCCKDKKLSLFLQFKPIERHDEQYHAQIKPILMNLFDWTEFQAQTIIDWASERKDYLIFEGIPEEVTKKSLKLVESKISHFVIDPSLQK